MYILVLSFYLFEITNLYNKSIHDIPTGIFFIQHKRFPKRDKKTQGFDMRDRTAFFAFCFNLPVYS